MSLKDIPGEKIRRQYFNIPLYTILSCGTALIMVLLAVSAKQDSTQAQEGFGVLAVIISMGLFITFPLAVLSILNRFYFGKIICVLDKKGLHFHDGDRIRFIPWNHIQSVSYEPDIPYQPRHSFRFECSNTAHITAKPFKKKVEIELIGAPLYLLEKMKKYRPSAKYGFTKWGLFLVLAYTFGPLLAALLAFLM